MSVQDRFREIAAGRVKRLEQELLNWEGDEDASLAETLRELHTLKGEANVLGQQVIAQLSHAVEDALGAVHTGQRERSPALLDGVLAALDAMGIAVSGASLPSEQVQAILAELGSGSSEGAPAEPAREQIAQPWTERERQTLLRVDPERIARLSELASDLLMLRDRGERRARELLDVVREVRRATRGEEPPWLARLVLLTRETSSDAFRNARFVGELSDQLRQLRLSPIRDLLEGYRRSARDLARRADKEINVEIHAEAVEVDQAVLEVLSEPLLHLIRNAIAHGVEGPKARAAAGKDRAGLLELTVRQSGAHVEVVVADDGRGLDPFKLQESARERGLIGPDEDLSEDEAFELIFQAGFSTAGELNELAGRGVGLDVVRQRLQELGGDLEVRSDLGLGTEFRLRLPLDLALSQALICVAKGSPYALAVDRVERVSQLEPGQRTTLAGRPGLRLGEITIPLLVLRDLLPGPGPTPEEARDANPEGPTPLVLLRTRRGLLALAPDAIMGQRDVAFRPLDPFLAELELVQSSCVLADGSVALQLDPLALARMAVARRATGRRAPRSRKVRVLVVDDSEITREVMAQVVESIGYQAIQARDGMDALERLSEAKPALVLSDLEMPRMGGRELTRQIRARPGPHLPVVIITTRGSAAERRACLDAGADAFIDKSKFRGEELVETLRRLVE